MARGLYIKRSAHAEFGESACTGWVLAQLLLLCSGCVHASRALYLPQVGGSDARTYSAHDEGTKFAERSSWRKLSDLAG